ncbi:MAG: TrkA family potassium uptake protein [Candidatus Babeliaceae bacterium]|nr:TrkA family potassium uptake protein [Candidatus Babeliaceae bacterium]
MKFCVIGVGRFGYHVATTLAARGIEVMAVDSNESVIASVRDLVTQAICMRVTDEESLRSIGVEGVDTVIVAVGENFAQSILITALLKQRLEIKNVVVRSISPIHRDILDLIGADHVVLPEQEMGIRLADQLSFAGMPFIQVTEEYAVALVKTPSNLVNRSAGSIDWDGEYKVKLLGRKILERVEEYAPSDLIGEEDLLVCAGSNYHLKIFADQ